LFGDPTSQSIPSGGFFGATKPQPTLVAGLLGSTSQSAQQTTFSSAATSQPGQGLFNNPTNAAQPNNMFGGLNQSTATKPAASLNLGQQPALGTSTSTARIDLEHLRPTTKFDQLTEELQSEILSLDTHILNEINRCNEVSNLLPNIAASGSNIPNDVSYITQKLEEVETGLENDAAEIQELKENTLKKDADEAKLCFREMDRLKMPSHYQNSMTNSSASISAGVYGGHGLPGWWNHPQTLQRSIRGGTGAGGSRALQIPGDEDEAALESGSASLVNFFEQRTDEMKQTLTRDKALLAQIEEFVVSVECKLAFKQRELQAGDGASSGLQGDDQLALLRHVFEQFERGLLEVADKVGEVRDEVQEIIQRS
jgi:nucleoporin p58/p45